MFHQKRFFSVSVFNKGKLSEGIGSQLASGDRVPLVLNDQLEETAYKVTTQHILCTHKLSYLYSLHVSFLDIPIVMRVGVQFLTL